MAGLPLAERRAADRRATAAALAAGALHLHVQLVGLGDASAYGAEIAALAGAGDAKWYPKICERDAHIAHQLGLRDVQFVVAAVDENASAVQHRAHGAVA